MDPDFSRDVALESFLLNEGSQLPHQAARQPVFQPSRAAMSPVRSGTARRRTSLLALACLLAFAVLYSVNRHFSVTDGSAALAGFASNRHRYAFATLLHPYTPLSATDPTDGSLLAARHLNWMLRHNPATKSRADAPVIILIPSGAANDTQIAQLEAEGARPLALPPITTPDALANHSIDALIKMHLWKLVEYDRICFIDANVLIVAPLDGVFDDPAGRSYISAIAVDTPLASYMPSRYVLAAQYNVQDRKHTLPPSNPASHFSTNMFVLKPSLKAVEFYERALQLLDWSAAADVEAPLEQAFLNRVHNRTGPMPWRALDQRWNVGSPTQRDLQAGVLSLSDRFWGNDTGADVQLKTAWRGQVEMMERHYRLDKSQD